MYTRTRTHAHAHTHMHLHLPIVCVGANAQTSLVKAHALCEVAVLTKHAA